MDQTSLEFYQRLQIIVYFLNQDDWPEKEVGLSREEAITFMANLLSLDPQDPKFLDKAYLKINQMLIDQQPIANIPPNLKQLVEDYEIYLLQTQETDLQALFPNLDEETRMVFDTQQQAVLEELKKEKSLQTNPLLAKIISHRLTKKLIGQLPLATSKDAFQRTYSIADYQRTIDRSSPIRLTPTVIQKISQETWTQAINMATIRRNLPLPTEIPTRPTSPVITTHKGVFSLSSFLKKIILSPIVKPLQIAAKISLFKIPPVIKKAISQGLTSNELKSTIFQLITTGLAPQDSQIIELDKQKILLTQFETDHPFLTKVLTNYHEFSKKRQLLILSSITPKLARKSVLSPIISPIYQKIIHPVSIWFKKNTSGRFKSFFSNFGILLKKIIAKPEVSIFGGAGLMGFSLAAPLPTPIKLLFFSSGTISTISGVVNKSPKTINRVISWFGNLIPKASGFFSKISLSSAALPSLAGLPLGLIIGGIFIVIAALTLITITTAGSSMVPFGEVGENIAHLGTLVTPRPPDQAGHLAEKVIYTLNQCGVTRVYSATWSTVETCLLNSNLENKQIIIDEFHYSVFSVGPGLQCVGFAKGVMAALGKPLDKPDIVGARDYLSPPPPTGYQLITSGLENVQIGDLVIDIGTTYGHIAVVVNKTSNGIWVAQAWGNDNGLLEIREINPVYYDGYLRPL